MAVTITAGTTTATVTYTRPGCSGTWTMVHADDQVLHLREQITDGMDRCTDEGTVTLTLRSGPRLGVAYVSGGRPYTATAALTRQPT
jgi:hypothetical protein